MSPNPKELEEKLDPRIKRTHGLILQAFGELLAEKGFESISVQDLTDKAEINCATIYKHCVDKYALLDYTIKELFKQEIEKRTLDACHYTPENLRNLILSEEMVREWRRAHEHPMRPLVKIGQLWTLAMTWYSTWLQENSWRPQPDEMRTIFAGLGGDF